MIKINNQNKIIASRFFENQPYKSYCHLSEKVSKGRLLGPDKLKNHTNEEKGKDRKKKEQGGRKEEKFL